MVQDKLGTSQKALRINLDARRYGAFAEIGAGQEVARWFVRFGGASGTVAKTISAYDMAVSDAIYGPAERYVSRQRLRSMLDHEYDLLVERLEHARGDKTAFFVFANTVATRARRARKSSFTSGCSTRKTPASRRRSASSASISSTARFTRGRIPTHSS